MIDAMGLALAKGLTVVEFIDWLDERGAQGDRQRYELIDGDIVAMVGATLDHARVVVRLARLIGNHLEGSRCEVWSESTLVKNDDRCAFLPDVFVTCQRLQPGTSRVSDPPVLMLEVLSPSTAHRDRGVKLARYREIPSVQQYVVIDPTNRVVESYSRLPDSSWVLVDHSASGILPMAVIDLELELANIFAPLDRSS